MKQTFQEWCKTKLRNWGLPRLLHGLSPAPLILVLLAIVGVIFRNDPAGAWNKITER